MERRDLLKLLGASLGGASLAACAKDTAAPTDPLAAVLPPLPANFAFYPLQRTGGGLPGGGTLAQFRLDVTATDRNGAYCTGIEASGALGLYHVEVDYSTARPGTLGASRFLRTGDSLGGRTLLGIHNYDANRAGDVAAIVSFADASAATGGPAITKEVWLNRWGSGSWVRLLYDGFVTPDGHTLTGLFDDIDVHTGCDILVTAWYRNKNEIAAKRAQLNDPEYPDDTKTQQAIFHLTGGDPATTRVELRDDQLQATDGGVAAIGLIDMHDNGNYALQAFPGRLRNGAGAAAPGALLVQGRVGAGGRAAVPLTAPAGGSANPLFSLLGGPSGDAYFGPRVAPNGTVAYLLQGAGTATDLYYGGARIVGAGDVVPGFSRREMPYYQVAAVNPPVFGNESEAYFVVESPMGVFLCATNGHVTFSYYPWVIFPQEKPLATSIALGHVSDSVDSAGRLYLFTMLDDGTTTLSVAIPQ